MIRYLLLSNVVFTVLFIVYTLWFRRLTFFRLNRVYLLASLVVAALLPLVQLPPYWAEMAPVAVVHLPTLVIGAATGGSIATFAQALTLIYWMGVAVSLVWVLRAVWHIWRGHLRAEQHQDHVLIKGIRAFSFFHSIQIGKGIDRRSREMILAHERLHSMQGHSIDVLLFAIARALAWFNPFVYWAAREVQLNHEFLVDHALLTHYGQSYQHNLLNTAMGAEVFPLTNSFNSKSLLTQRILMMNKQRTRRNYSATYLLTLPIIAGALWLNACSTQMNDDEHAGSDVSAGASHAADTYRSDEVDVVPAFTGGHDAMLQYFEDNFNYPSEARSNEVEGTVFVSFVVGQDGSLSEVKSEKTDDERLVDSAIDFVKRMPNWEPGQKNGSPVNVKMVLPIRYELQ